jgi:small conductance mechanosensitive channel
MIAAALLPMPLQDSSTPRNPGFGELLDFILSLAPSALTLVVTIVILAALHYWLERRKSASPGHTVRNQLILLAVTALGLVSVVLMLPISDNFRGEILKLIGIVLSAGIALSSTTFLGNMLAGFMLRSVRNFRAGDFISVEEHFGRVSGRGLFHTEIQTEERTLTTLPNIYLVTHPVTTLRSSGTVVSATVSLGYDVPRGRIEELLLEAAREADLADAFVSTMELGDFSVTYRIAGLLTNVKSLITARSRLRAKVLDRLHEGGVEIVSPTFMNTRALTPDQVFVPESGPARSVPEAKDVPAPEEILFDKADQAEASEEMAQTIDSVTNEIKGVDEEIKSAPAELMPALEARRRELETKRDQLEAELEETKNDVK